MKIKEILTLDLSEDIKNVIDLEDVTEAEIKSEIENYIVTEGLAKEYADFVDKYTSSNNSETGVWISGFYGSGKSYFGKLLGYMISNQIIAGTGARDRILQRFGGISDEALIKNSISRLSSIISNVVFLDIAKQDTSKGFAFALFKNFLKSLNLPQNEHGFLLYNLMIDESEVDVASYISRHTSHNWSDIKGKRIRYIKTIKSIYMDKDNSESNYNNIMETIRRDIDQFSADLLKVEINNYLNIKNNERIVFLFDEASEALTQKKFTLLDLEGVSEALSSLGGRVWTIAIAQEKLDDVINNSNVNKAQLTKVTDRFKTKIHLEATEVDIIIQNRLLKKTDLGIEQLKAHYDKKAGQILDHAAIKGGGITKTDSFESYSTYYPFYKYQFDLLQNFLFGTKGFTSTKVAARGMIHTTYEILKFKVQHSNLFDTVTAWQITEESQPTPDIRLVNRYDNATRILKEEQSAIDGRNLLETIHLLSEAEVTPTTVSNIIKCYISNPDQYTLLKQPIEKALESLTEAKILLNTNNTYRITSDIEQRLLDEMNEYAIQGFIKKKQLVNEYKDALFTKSISKVLEGGTSYDFYLTTDNEDNLSKTNKKALNVKFKSVYTFSESREKDIEQLKTEYQQDKSTIWLVPDNSKFKKIDRLIDEIERINNLEQKYRNPNSDIGKIMVGFSSSKEEKQVELRKLVEDALINGTMIYLFNTYQLTKDNWESLLKQQQQQVINNVYSKRLSTQLSDSLAKSVIKERDNSRLHKNFNGNDFTFFDTQGNFVGEHLKVVEEILYKIKNTYVDGKTLEMELEEPPTGFDYGTIVTTLAVLLRAGRVIVKHNGRDFYSWQDKGVEEVFSNSRNFRTASFKAISKSLTASQKQAIAKFLLDMDIAQYRDRDEAKIDYNTNDFELVNAVRVLAKNFEGLVNKLKHQEDKFDTLFPHIEAKVQELREFTGAVSEANYIDKATYFLSHQDTFHEAISTIQKVDKFIEKKLPKAKLWESFVQDVQEELAKAARKNDRIDADATTFNTLFKKNVVKNYQTLRTLRQGIKDEYYQLFSTAMETCAEQYATLEIIATELVDEINSLPKGLNSDAIYKAQSLIRYAANRKNPSVRIENEVKNLVNNFTYSEVLSFIELFPGKKIDAEILQASLVREAPPIQANTEEPELMITAPTTPKVRKFKTSLPRKEMSVASYKNWLRHELQKLATAKDDDQIEITN